MSWCVYEADAAESGPLDFEGCYALRDAACLARRNGGGSEVIQKRRFACKLLMHEALSYSSSYEAVRYKSTYEALSY